MLIRRASTCFKILIKKYSKMYKLFCLVFLISSFGICYCKQKQVSESYQIAIESAGNLLPTVEFIERLTKDLEAIRSKFPDMRKVQHIPKWEPGVLFLTDVKSDILERINRSEYGPVDAQSILGNDLYKLMFHKPYNPEILAGLLKAELSILNAEPNWVTGRSTYITVSAGVKDEKLYNFRKSKKPCNVACDDIRTTIFKVGLGQQFVEMVSDSGSDVGKSTTF